MDDRGRTVCLNMIVKDEAHIIRRCLDSVRPLIDAWVISDTGSSDGTQGVIREAMAGVPGTLLERPWVDFGHNRTEVLEASRGRCDYSLMMDADDRLEIAPGFSMPTDGADSYNMLIRDGGLVYHRRQLVRSALPWRYVGVLHEYIACEEARSEAFLPGLTTIRVREGARSRDPLTYRRDAIVFERALLDEPGNARYVFYLAQSYRDCGDFELALRHYRRRATMEGWADEAWHSLYQAAQLEERLGRPWPEVMASYLAAFQFLPDRAEPLYRVAMHHQNAKEYHTARLYFDRAMKVTRPGPTRLFVESMIYDFLLELEYAVACHHTGDYAEAVAVNDRLLGRGTLPAHLVEMVTRNLRAGRNALLASAAPLAPAMPAGWAPQASTVPAMAT